MQSVFFCLEVREGGGLICMCRYSFWRGKDFFKAVERLQFLTRAELFFDLQFLHALFVMSTIFYREGNIQPLCNVKGLQQYTS